MKGPTRGEIAFTVNGSLVHEDGYLLLGGNRTQEENAANRAHLCRCWNTYDELLHLAKLLEASLLYQIARDERSGDDEGARLKGATLHSVRETIARAEVKS